ncbi:hypothetical protein ACJMK2_044666 [Sinanodonta woodiana]|uniref:Protein kinase domain-containing protein n=1 Tax=Sinanodonta woodiana TaxID=1069815 RepID=A0ABD3W0T0_SINWO
MSVHEQVQDFWIKESIKDRKLEDTYVLGKELGRGATSQVYKCTHKGSGESWAVKVINKKIDKKVVRTEIGALLKLKHKHVIRLKEIFETPQQMYLVLELVTGGELFDRIVIRGSYTEKDASDAVRQMLEAVEYLHQNDVVHRDMKPENLLYEDLSNDANLKIADFGLSKIITEETMKMTTVCGTPGYCAPEILMGQGYGPSVDIWSLGVIAYILLCGYEPFYEDNENLMYKRIIKADYSFDSPYWDNITENAKDLIRKLLTKDPKKRPTATQALKHPWVRGVAAKNDHMEGTQSKIKEFNAKRKLKAATDVALMLASHFTEDLDKPLHTSDLSIEVKHMNMAEMEAQMQNEA